MLAQREVSSTEAARICQHRVVLTWAELELASPGIAALGRDLLERFQFVLVGTLTKDGSPRVNPCEAYVIDGHLLLNMMPRSLKAFDLLRDSRIYVHTPVTSKDAGDGEFKLAGSAPVLEDAGLRRKLDDLFWQMIQWRPAPDSHYFEVLAERIAYHKYGGDEIALRWRATRLASPSFNDIPARWRRRKVFTSALVRRPGYEWSADLPLVAEGIGDTTELPAVLLGDG